MVNSVRLKFFGVLEMPENPLPNAFYFVLNGDRAEAWLTSKSGVPKQIGNTQMVTDIVSELISNDVQISEEPDNRIERKPDGLYVRDDFDPDPLPFYILSRG